MKAKYLFVFSLLATILFQYIGTAEKLYSAVWEYDSFMHIMGGICAGSFGVWVAQKKNLGKGYYFLFAIAFSFSIGWLWELKQIYINGYNFPLSDTITDLFADTLGGIIAAVYLYKKEALRRQ